MNTITEIGDALRAEPRSYAEMPSEWQTALEIGILPDRFYGFAKQQADWIYSWLLEVTEDKLSELQSIHPHQYAARESVDGKLYLSAALLTDAVDDRRLSETYDILSSLKLVYVDAVEFPVPIIEEI